jgi:hypothetical protein
MHSDFEWKTDDRVLNAGTYRGRAEIFLGQADGRERLLARCKGLRLTLIFEEPRAIYVARRTRGRRCLPEPSMPRGTRPQHRSR